MGRTLQESIAGGYPIANVIQISIPINPGNSGGPLLNSLGQVVGITTAIIVDSQGIGFAITSDTILKVLPDLVIHGSYNRHPWIGAENEDLTLKLARELHLNVTYGWLVSSVLPSSPAENAGMKGDVIIAINGFRIRNGDDLLTYLEIKTEPGQIIMVTIIRFSSEIGLNLTLGSRPPLK